MCHIIFLSSWLSIEFIFNPKNRIPLAHVFQNMDYTSCICGQITVTFSMLQKEQIKVLNWDKNLAGVASCTNPTVRLTISGGEGFSPLLAQKFTGSS